MAGNYWQPAALSNNPVAYPGIPGVPTSAGTTFAPGVSGRTVNLGGGMSKPNPFGIPANTWTGGAPAPYYQAPITEGGWGPDDIQGQQRNNAYNAAHAAQNYGKYSVLMGGGGAGAAGGGYGASGGYSGRGGAGGNPLSNLTNEFQSQMNRANAANEARYQDILKGYQQRFETGAGQLQGMGAQEGRDINELYDKQRAQQNQNLIGRGLGNSTVLSTMNAGNDRERAADLGRLNERVRQQSIGTMAGLSGDELNFMASKNENAPSWGQLAQLATGIGTAGYGAGGGGAGGLPAQYDSPGGSLGYQNPAMFGYGQNGGGWGGYGNNGSGYIAGSNRRAPPAINRGPALPPGTNLALLAQQMNNGISVDPMGLTGNGDFMFSGNPTSASSQGQSYDQILAQTLADAFGG